MRSKLLALVLAFVLLFGGASAVGAAGNTNLIVGDNNSVIFIDVGKEWQWAQESIYYFAEQGIVNGVGDGRFAPGEKVTREQFAKMLVLTFNAPLTAPEEPTFADVPREKWSYPYIETAKEFLTGYANPFGGKMTFQPTAAATREDIAVALVRMMGLTDRDAKDPNYARWVFADAGNISPGLVPYISIAAERGLIAGYPDGTFRPNQSITRAETVVLLHRAMKQAVTSYLTELDVTASIVTGRNPAEVTLMIQAEEGTKITVDGKPVRMENMGNGYSSGSVLYTFTEEGSKTFIIEAEKAGKRARIEKTAQYEIGAPELAITEAPESVSKNSAVIRGIVKDRHDRYPLVTVNGESVYVDGSGRFEKTVNLTEGENRFTIVATNSLGKQTTVERTIVFTAGAPEITITDAPETATSGSVTIRGIVKDPNDRYPQVTVNGESVYVDGNGRFEKTVNLTEGANKITIVATNALGKRTTVERTVTFTGGAPEITITDAPETATSGSVTIRGIVKDPNDRYPQVTVNGESVYVDGNGRFEKTVRLTEGANKITIVATNKLGKQTKVERTVTFTAGAPEITITDAPETATSGSVTIRGIVKDPNDRYPQVTVNGESVYVDGSGRFEKSVRLTEGANKVTIVATNTLGKRTTVERTIVFNASAPEIVFTNVPEVTNQKYITLQGYVKNAAGSVKLYVNDQEVFLSSFDGSFSKSVTLTEGDNHFVFRAVNQYGKSTSIAKTVRYGEITAPTLTVDPVPGEVTSGTLTVTGTVSDNLDPAVEVYVNDQKVASSAGSWSATVNLKEGVNDIIVVATNKYGKSTTVVNQVTYKLPEAAPEAA